MNPLVLLTALFASALAAPSVYVEPTVGPVVPAPFFTQATHGEPVVTVHRPPPVASKQITYADRTYVAGYDTTILKPAVPDFRIAVPTALKGTVTHQEPIVKVVKETHVVDKAVPVEKPYPVPYEVIKNVVQTVQVPTPVHVDKPYPVPRPVTVLGKPQFVKVQGPPVVLGTHHATAIHPIAGVPTVPGWN